MPKRRFGDTSRDCPRHYFVEFEYGDGRDELALQVVSKNNKQPSDLDKTVTAIEFTMKVVDDELSLNYVSFLDNLNL